MPRRVRIDLAYDGTEFDGWQVQPRGRTVQGELERALSTLHGGVGVRVRGAGRTDAGVHARGQVADALVGDRFSDRDLHRALLALLPDDLRVQRVLGVDERFHARHAAIAKTYAYYLDRSRCGDPFVARYVLHTPHSFDEGAVDAALALLPGRRDFSGFAGAACEVTDRVRSLTEARREVVRPGIERLVFTADGFLNHMVRNFVGTLLDVARGRQAPDRVRTILESGDRTLGGATAPARGLTLERVAY
jgi:tRNA pseudouridine38-40 synthase